MYMLEVKVAETMAGEKARTGLNDAPVNGYAKICKAHIDKPIAIGAETFFAMTERVLHVFVNTTHVKKKVPNTSNMKPDEKVLPKFKFGAPTGVTPPAAFGIVATTKAAPNSPPAN